MFTLSQPLLRLLALATAFVWVSILAQISTSHAATIYLDSGEPFPVHPGLQEVTLFQPVPQSPFLLAIIQQFPPRLIKFNYKTSNDSSSFETLMSFSNGSYATSSGTWSSGYLYFTLFEAQSRRINLYRTNGFANGTGLLGESYPFITSSYATSAHVFYYLFNSSSNEIQIIRENLPDPASVFSIQPRVVQYSLSASALPTSRASLPAAVAQDFFFFIPPAPVGARELWVSMPNQSVSVQYTSGSSIAEEDDVLQVVSMNNSATLIWSNAMGSLFRCCPNQLDSMSQAPNSTYLEKISETHLLIDRTPFTIYDIQTYALVSIGSTYWRPGSAKMSGTNLWLLFDGTLQAGPSVGYIDTLSQAPRNFDAPGEFVASPSADSVAVAWGQYYATVMKNATHGLFVFICQAPASVEELLSCRAETLLAGFDFLPASYPDGSMYFSLEISGDDQDTILMSILGDTGFGILSLSLTPGPSVVLSKILDVNPSFSIAPLRVTVLEAIDASTNSLLVEQIQFPQRQLILTSDFSRSIIDTLFMWDSCSSPRIRTLHSQIRFLTCEYSGERFLVAVNITGAESIRLSSTLDSPQSFWPTESGLLFVRVGSQPGNPAGDLVILDVTTITELNSTMLTSMDLTSIFSSGQVILLNDAVVGVVDVGPSQYAVFFDTGIVVHVSYDPTRFPQRFAASIVLNMYGSTLSPPVMYNSSLWIRSTDSANSSLISISVGNSSALTTTTTLLSLPNPVWNGPGALIVVNNGSRLVWISRNTTLILLDSTGLTGESIPLVSGVASGYVFCGEIKRTGEIILINGSSAPLVAAPGVAPGVVGPIKHSATARLSPWIFSDDWPLLVLSSASSPRMLVAEQSQIAATLSLERRVYSISLPCKSDSYCPSLTRCNTNTEKCEPLPPLEPIALSEPAAAAPSGCLSRPPSTTGFVCEAGEWVYLQSIVVSATANGTHLFNLTISGTVRVRGNFTIDESISEDDVALVIRPGARLIVDGCVSVRGVIVVDLTAAILISRNGSFVIMEFESYCFDTTNSSTTKRAPPVLFTDVEPVQNAITLKSCETLSASLEYNQKSISVLFSAPEATNGCAPTGESRSFDISAVTGITWGILVVLIVAGCIGYYYWVRTKNDEHAEEDAEMDLELQDAADAAGALPMTPRFEDGNYIDLSQVEGAIKNRLAALNLIPAADVKLLHQIGSGSYGTVSLGLYKSALVAVKQMKGAAPKLLDSFLAEAAIHQALPSHPNICKMHGLCVDQPTQTYSIVVEFAPAGSIADVSESTADYAEKLCAGGFETFKAVYGIACGMQAVAKADVIHRDLSARNILLDEKWFPKISDFGGSRAVLDAHSGSQTASNFGPIRWMAPENFTQTFSEKSDVWAFGCTLIEIVTQELPYQAFDGDLADLAVAIRDDGLNPLVDLVDWLEENKVKLPRWFRDVLEPCFEQDPQKRPSFADIVEKLQTSHPEFYSKYAIELENFVETPLNVSAASLVAAAAAFARKPAADLSDSLGFGGSSSASSESEDNNVHRQSIARALSKELTFTPRLPDVSKARVLSELGRGSFGTVYLGKFQAKYVAIKQIHSVTNAAGLIKEAGFMMSLRQHRNVVQLLGVRTGRAAIGGGQTVELVMEFATCGSLWAYIKRECDLSRGMRLPEHLLYRFALGIARGMASVSLDRVVHRDLAARNILLNSALEPLVSDFGFARQLAEDQTRGETATSFGPVRWMAPESLGQKPSFSEKSDVWSYGVILFEMVTGAETPYAALELIDVAKMVKAGQLDPISYYKDELSRLNPPEFIIELAEKCLQFSPDDRFTFSEIVSWLELNAPADVRSAEARRLKRQQKRDAVFKAIDQIVV